MIANCLNLIFVFYQVLDASAKTYECLMGEQYSTTPRVDVARSTLLDSLGDKFVRSAAAFQDVSKLCNIWIRRCERMLLFVPRV